MKYLKLTFVIALSLLLMSSSPYLPNLDKKEDKLKGSVKLIIEDINHFTMKYRIFKEYSKSGKVRSIKFYSTKQPLKKYFGLRSVRTLKKLEKNDSLYLVYQNQYTYSDLDSLLRFTRLNFINLDTVAIYNYSYDQNGRLLSRHESLNFDGDTFYNSYRWLYEEPNDSTMIETLIEVSGEYDYEVDTIKRFITKNKNALIKQIKTCDHFNSDRIETYYYDKSGRLRSKEKSEPNMTNQLFEQTVFFYQADKLYRKLFTLDSPINIRKKETLYFYDSKGSLNKVLEMDSHNNTFFKYSDKRYNEYGDITSWSEINSFIDEDGKFIDYVGDSSRLEYVYDSMGNWIVKKWFTGDKLNDAKKRVIEYHDN